MLSGSVRVEGYRRIESIPSKKVWEKFSKDELKEIKKIEEILDPHENILMVAKQGGA